MTTNMKRLKLGTVMAVSLSALTACSTVVQKPQIAFDRELRGFKQVSEWKNAEPVVIILAMQMFATAGRFQEGVEHFHALAQRSPENPLYAACEGVLMARMAGAVPLRSRIQWVHRALAKLDAGAASKRTDTMLLRGLVEAELPFFFHRKQQAVDDLEAALKSQSDLPFYGGRGIHAALARAYARRGDAAKSAEHLAAAGSPNLEDAGLLADGSYSLDDGYRFTAPATVAIGEKRWMLMGYDFTTVYAFDTPEGLVVIDAGTTPENGRAIREALRAVSAHSIHTVIVTHAHWDHIGGLRGLVDKGSAVVARGNFRSELAKDNEVLRLSQTFFGKRANADAYDLTPTRTVDRRTTLTVGGLELELIPMASGETDDALVVFEPRERLAIVGDILMPYFGAPWAAEGDPEGAIAAIKDLKRLNPAKIYGGHPPLTRYFGVDALAGIEKALQESIPQIEAGVARGESAAQILNTLPIPDSLREEPRAVLAYLIMRSGLIQRVDRAHAGYWQPEREGVSPRTLEEMAGAVDMVAGGSAAAFATATDRLLERGDIDLAEKIAEYGMIKHPDDQRLKEAFDRAIAQNRQRNELINPFKFLVYSNVGGRELAPVKDGSR